MCPSNNNTCVRLTYKNSHYLVPVEFILRVHPGGQRLILPYVNQDITRAFVEAKHSKEAIQLLEQWMEGGLAATAAGATAANFTATAVGTDSLEDETGEDEPLAVRWRRQFATWSDAEVVTTPSSILWNVFVFGVAGATAMAAVLCRQ